MPNLSAEHQIRHQEIDYYQYVLCSLAIFCYFLFFFLSTFSILCYSKSLNSIWICQVVIRRTKAKPSHITSFSASSLPNNTGSKLFFFLISKHRELTCHGWADSLPLSIIGISGKWFQIPSCAYKGNWPSYLF